MFYGIRKQTAENFLELSKNKRIVLWGFVSDTIRNAVSQYGEPECIIDSDSERWGTRFGSLVIYPPEHLYALSPETHIVLVTAKSASAYSTTKAIEAIDDFDIFYFNAISDKFFCHFSNQLYDNRDKIEKTEKMLSDDRSKKVYREVVRRRIMGATGEFNSLKTRDNPQYIFLPMFKQLTNDEIFVDCGGYTGDSVEKFVTAFGNNVRKIYSFECFKENITLLRETGSRLNEEGWSGELVAVPYAVSDKNSTVIFNDIGNPEGGYLPETRLTVQYNDNLAPVNAFEVETRTIDDFIPQNERVTLIKMDIEGAEYSALMGAEKTISAYKPRLAVSIYHNPSDYWRICELIHGFSADYKFAVRHHQSNHLDTVLYAWVEE